MDTFFSIENTLTGRKIVLISAIQEAKSLYIKLHRDEHIVHRAFLTGGFSPNEAI